jgi:hypothetical protein
VRFHLIRELAEQTVSGHVPVDIVDLLEAVEIEDGDAELTAPQNTILQLGFGLAPIGEASQSVNRFPRPDCSSFAR